MRLPPSLSKYSNTAVLIIWKMAFKDLESMYLHAVLTTLACTDGFELLAGVISDLSLSEWVESLLSSEIVETYCHLCDAFVPNSPQQIRNRNQSLKDPL